MARNDAAEPIRKDRLQEEIAGPTVTGVRPTTRSYAFRELDPRRLARVLREAEDGDPIRYLELAEDMEERDLHYLSVLGTRRRQVSQLNVTVEPGADTAEAEADAELVRAFVGRNELEEEIFDLLDAVGKGFSVSEIIWEHSERQWMPVRLAHRLPTWFRYDWETGYRLVRRDEAEVWAELEPAKFVVHEHAAKSGIPIRGGLARAVAWSWMFKTFGVKDWLRFAEAYGHPIRIGKYDKGATEPEKDVLLRAVRNIAGDFSAIIPEGMEIVFEQSEGTGARSDLYRDLLWYFDSAVSKAVLGQTLTTQESSEGGGAYALGQIHDEVRQDIERSDARQVAATLTRDLARPIVLLNQGERAAYPRIRIGREEQHDPAVIAELVSKLTTSGVKLKATQVRELTGFDEPEDGDELVGERAAAEDGSDDGTPPGNLPAPEMARALARVLAQRGGDRRDTISREVEALVRGQGWEPLLEPVVDPLLAEATAALDRGGNLEAFRGRLAGIFERMDDARLVELLGRTGFSAALSGDAGLTDVDDS